VDALDLVTDVVDVDGLRLSILRPREAEALLSEEAFEQEEFLPYWAEMWPSGLALAGAVRARPLERLRVLELGCGLGVPSVVAALGGACVLATDWSPEALEVTAANAARNRAELETALVSWAEAEPLLARAPWELVLAADVLYERRNVDQLLALLPRLVAAGGEILLAEPGRPPAARFFEEIAADLEVTPLAERLYRLGKPGPVSRLGPAGVRT
jgi:predicted nicotinamide N-methyase